MAFPIHERAGAFLLGYRTRSNDYDLGGLWNGIARPPLSAPDPQNYQRLFKTKGGNTITIDDTPGIGKIEIKNKIGSSITLNADGSVTVSAKTNLTLKADKVVGTITLDAGNVKVSLPATGTMDVS